MRYKDIAREITYLRIYQRKDGSSSVHRVSPPWSWQPKLPFASASSPISIDGYANFTRPQYLRSRRGVKDMLIEMDLDLLSVKNMREIGASNFEDFKGLISIQKFETSNLRNPNGDLKIALHSTSPRPASDLGKPKVSVPAPLKRRER